CSCPGQPAFDGLDAPGQWFIAENGGTELGAKITLSGQSLDDHCKSLPHVPPVPGAGCPLNDCGQAGGGGHLATFDGGLYEFQGAGEFTLAKSTKKVKDPLEVQERLQPESFAGKLVTWPTAVAMRVGTSTIGFYANPSSAGNNQLTARIDKRPVTISRP